MNVEIFETTTSASQAAARLGIEKILEAIHERSEANIVLATGLSQVEMLSYLTADQEIDWSHVTAFHLDEYVGIPAIHRASFRRYLSERFECRVQPLRAFHYIDGSCSNPLEECDRLSALITKHPIDVCFVGIGENAHLAFNDPPADFDITAPYIVVELDRDCKQQQVNEGWFPTVEAVPNQAISMSIQHILKSKTIVATVPGQRKAAAVRAALEGPITNSTPSSILQTHSNCWVILDAESASLLDHNRCK